MAATSTAWMTRRDTKYSENQQTQSLNTQSKMNASARSTLAPASKPKVRVEQLGIYYYPTNDRTSTVQTGYTTQSGYVTQTGYYQTAQNPTYYYQSQAPINQQYSGSWGHYAQQQAVQQMQQQHVQQQQQMQHHVQHQPQQQVHQQQVNVSGYTPQPIAPQQSVRPSGPSRPSQPDQPMYNPYAHPSYRPSRSSHPSHSNQQQPAYNPYGDPNAVPLEYVPPESTVPCRWFGSAQGCKLGASCRKSHSQPESVKLCPRFKPGNTRSCNWGDECWFRHDKCAKDIVVKDSVKDIKEYDRSAVKRIKKMKDYKVTGILSKQGTVSPVIRSAVKAAMPSDEVIVDVNAENMIRNGSDDLNVSDNSNKPNQNGGGFQYPQNNQNEKGTDLKQSQDSKMTKMTKLETLDYGLAAYYFAMDRSDYFNQNGKGKLTLFLEEHKLDEAAVDSLFALNGDSNRDSNGDHEDEKVDEFKDSDDNIDDTKYTKEVFLAMDEFFPIDKSVDSLYTMDRDQAIVTVIESAYNYGIYMVMECCPERAWKVLASGTGMENGAPLKRMCEALVLFSTMDIEHNDADRLLFLKFINQTYYSFLVDWVHIMGNHEEGTGELIPRGMLRKCTMDNCLTLFLAKSKVKHYYQNNKYLKSQQIWNQEQSVLFYRDLVDAMHCYLIERNDIGMLQTDYFLFCYF